MVASPSIADWKQRGRVALWRYDPMPRMYSGWHFTADPEGCSSLDELFLLLLTAEHPAHRTVTLIDPRPIGADRIFGEHSLRVRFPEKLRFAFDPKAPRDHSDFVEADGKIEHSIGETWLREWQAALADIAQGDADFSIRFQAEKPHDPMKRITFWWWP